MSDHDTMPTEPQPGRYRHYKGGLYTVICLGRHSETEEWLVTYRAEANGTFWVRPLAMWIEAVLHEGIAVPRFAFIGSYPIKSCG
ncbi:DUF1653 domain-containing protein [Lichenicola cladoniae]|nr:DUF1653 domain-containing protein [Lichenicola cladoniae]